MFDVSQLIPPSYLLHLIAGNLAQAEMIGKEALKILPKDHTIMFSLANVLGKQQKYKVCSPHCLLFA